MIAALLASPVALASQDTYGTGDGHSGTLNATNQTINTLNKFAQLTADIKAGDKTLTVDVGGSFAANDLVLVWQVGGFAAPQSGSPGPFDLSNDAAGRYELARVTMVNGNVVTVEKEFLNGFAKDVTQVVQVPEYASVTLNNTTINAPPWNGRTGGVVAFLSKGGVTLNGGSTISADGSGFRGGVNVNSPMMTMGCTGLDEAVPGGAQKGEGAATSKYGPSVTGYGNIANAGGGGVCQNSGGGGGGNGGAGGKGGRTSIADGSRDVGGRGGGAETLSLLDHLVFGGGGGAGHGDDNKGASGGAGGGVVFIRADSINNGGLITAGGGSGLIAMGSDGAGGGGAGGSIVVRVVKSVTCGTIQASGGLGGNVNGRDYAPGGGGGGGRILLQAATQNMCANALFVDGGTAGIQNNANAMDGPSYGAKGGAPGTIEGPPGSGGYCGSDANCPDAMKPACQPKGYCDQCSLTNATQCKNMTPTCDVPTGQCRACKVDADCRDPKFPACQPNGSCGECSQTNGTLCTNASRKPVCDVAKAVCVACASDADCKNPQLPVCQTKGGQSGACGQCGPMNKLLCKDTTPICDEAAYTCAPCKMDAECLAAYPATPVCLMSTGACVQCTGMNKTKCTGGTPACNEMSNTCVLCVPGVDSTACVTNADGHACQAGMNNSVFCGCGTDTDCGAKDSGRVCDAATHKCIDGCSPAPDRNTCKAPLVCTSGDLTGKTIGMCTTGCTDDAHCKAMQMPPHCLKLNGAVVGHCVQCTMDADCTDPAKPVCADDTNTCVQCTPMKTGACNPATIGGVCFVTRVCGCNTDSDCGGVMSGRICDEQMKTCGPGCRGTGGNGCAPNETCSSKDNTPGTCSPTPMPDGGMAGFRGASCSVGHGRSARGGLPIALVLGALGLVAWRRRRRASGAALVALLVGLAALAPASAQAQSKGFQLNRYEPSAAGDWTFAVEHPWYSSTRWFAGGITLNYGHNPLVYGSVDNGKFVTQQAVIGNQLLGHLDLAGSMFDRVALTLSLPVTLFESGDAINGVGPVGVAVGDPRVGVRARIFGQPDKDAVSLSAGVQLWIPIGANGNHAGDTGVRVLPKLIAAGFVSKLQLRWAATAGFLYRPDGVIGDLPAGVGNVAGSALEFGAALGWGGTSRRFNIGPELAASTGVTGDNKFAKETSNVELLFGGQYLIANTLLVGAAVGGGLLRAGEPGTPDFRLLLRIAYAPIKRDEPARVVETDTDQDGVPDKADACIYVKGVATSDPRTNGCPPPPPEKDEDHDGVPDDLDNCPMEPQGKHPDPARKGCPAPDTDKDGFFDFEDQCPDVAMGPHPDPKRQGCPALDTDNDGVFDPDDVCPLVPAGLHPDPKKAGCPEPDRDGDSVPDGPDACPDKAGAPDPDPKKNGCPGLVTVKNGVIVILEPVFFATNKDVILPKSFPVLKAVANALKAQPVIKLVAVEGHTDNKGKLEKNMDLSDRRAKSVLKFLLKEGIVEGRLTAQGYGPKRPIATNSTEAGRAQNRRVEFHIIDPAVGGPTEVVPPVKAN